MPRLQAHRRWLAHLCLRSHFSPYAILFLMTARILDGIKIRDEMLRSSRAVTQMTAQGIRPGSPQCSLGKIRHRSFSKSKIAACNSSACGWLHSPPANVTTEYMLQHRDQQRRQRGWDSGATPLPSQVVQSVLESVFPQRM
jgi:hypothetical protein